MTKMEKYEVTINEGTNIEKKKVIELKEDDLHRNTVIKVFKTIADNVPWSIKKVADDYVSEPTPKTIKVAEEFSSNLQTIEQGIVFRRRFLSNFIYKNETTEQDIPIICFDMTGVTNITKNFLSLSFGYFINSGVPVKEIFNRIKFIGDAKSYFHISYLNAQLIKMEESKNKIETINVVEDFIYHLESLENGVMFRNTYLRALMYDDEVLNSDKPFITFDLTGVPLITKDFIKTALFYFITVKNISVKHLLTKIKFTSTDNKQKLYTYSLSTYEDYIEQTLLKLEESEIIKNLKPFNVPNPFNEQLTNHFNVANSFRKHLETKEDGVNFRRKFLNDLVYNTALWNNDSTFITFDMTGVELISPIFISKALGYFIRAQNRTPKEILNKIKFISTTNKKMLSSYGIYTYKEYIENTLLELEKEHIKNTTKKPNNQMKVVKSLYSTSNITKDKTYTVYTTYEKDNIQYYVIKDNLCKFVHIPSDNFVDALYHKLDNSN